MKKNFVKGLAILAVVLLAVVGFTPVLPTAEATTNAGYYEGQLTGNAAKFYTALENMAADGTFKTGCEDYDLLQNSIFMANQIPGNEAQYDALVSDFNYAVAVFELEHPEIFYVDFDALTLRALYKSTGKAKLSIGAGKRADYFAKPFTTEAAVTAAINNFDNAVAGYVNAANSASSVKNKVKSVHDGLISAVTYNAEVVGADNAYGALVSNAANARGMAKAMKVILDQMNIDTLVVNGTLNVEYNDEWLMSKSRLPVPTSWNLVHDGTAWYLVNAGEDNKLSENSGSSQTYFYKNHSACQTLYQPTATVAAGKTLSYPVLAGGATNAVPTTGISVNVNGLTGPVTQPTLIIEGDLSVSAWKMDDETSAKTYVPLDVVMSYSEAQGALLTKYQDFFALSGGSYDALDAYEFELYLCEESVKLIEQAGKALSVILPYPEGYNYNTANTVYTAYVFDKYEGHALSDHNNVDSITCVPTEYGLIVDFVMFNAKVYGGSDNDFCNYAITAKTGTTPEKHVVTVLNGGGEILSGSAIQTISSGSALVQAFAKTGYVIDSVTVNGVKQSLEGRTAYQLEVEYGSAAATTVVEINFIAETVFNAEQEAGLFSYNSQLDAAGNGGGGNGGSKGGCFGAVSMSNFALIAICLGFIGVGKNFIR